EHVSSGTCFLDQIVGDAFFLLLINAITDKKNMACSKGLIPIAIGFTNLALVLFAYGYNSGGPINPARDFAPRLFTLIAGWGPEQYSFTVKYNWHYNRIRNYNYFWIPLIATHLGAIIGSWIYVLFVENHWPEDDYDITESEAMHKNGTTMFTVTSNATKPATTNTSTSRF
ncbi:aquaporin-like protein, partial [Leptotrombidium deliense]